MAGNSDGEKVPPDKSTSKSSNETASFSTTTPWAVGGGNGLDIRMRTFAEII